MWEYFRIAIKVLRAHRFRSALTVLSITIGAFSIVVMSSLAESGMATLKRGLEEIGGARLIDVGGKKPERGDGRRESYFRGLTVADRDVLMTSLPHVEARTMWSSLWRKDLVGDNARLGRSDVVGGDSGFLPLFKLKLAAGRVFSEDEVRQHAKVCVVGHKLAQKMFDGVAVDHWLTTQGTRCHVVGQLADFEHALINFGFDWRDFVLMPITTLGDADPLVAQFLSITLRTDDPASNDDVKRVLNALLAARHNGIDDYEIWDFSTFMSKFDAIFGTMRLIVALIAGIALLVGGIGVMNMMLVSVSERVREIGVRKALGANPRDIAAQFLWESAVLAGSGGLAGIVGGIGGASLAGWIIGQFTKNWTTVWSMSAVVSAFCVSVGVGLVFGFFPARRAGALSAIEAIRR